METKRPRKQDDTQAQWRRALEVNRETLEAEVLPRYANGHTRALEQAEYLRSIASDPLFGETAYAALNALRQCGSWLEYQLDLDEEAKARLISGHLCKMYKLCPVCAMRRCGRGMAKYSWAINEAIADYPGKLVPFFTTFTIVNGHDLAERYDSLNESKRLLMKRRRNAIDGRGDPFLANIEGGVTAIEVKRGENSKAWHPHLHGIWLMRVDETDDRSSFALNKWATEKLREHWRTVADGFVVDARTMVDEGHFSRAITECFKYATKFSTMSVDEAWYCHLVTRGRRFLSSFGCLRGLGEPDGGEEMKREDVEWLRLHFQYQDDRNEPAYELMTEERGGS